jgi:hypothetical protein
MMTVRAVTVICLGTATVSAVPIAGAVTAPRAHAVPTVATVAAPHTLTPLQALPMPPTFPQNPRDVWAGWWREPVWNVTTQTMRNEAHDPGDA